MKVYSVQFKLMFDDHQYIGNLPIQGESFGDAEDQFRSYMPKAIISSIGESYPFDEF